MRHTRRIIPVLVTLPQWQNGGRSALALWERSSVDRALFPDGRCPLGNSGITDYMSDAAFDEKIMGTVHLALGRAYPSTGGTNESAIHWDLVKDLRESVRIICDGVTVFGEGPLVGRSRRRGRALTPLSAATH